jgi:hypothetical protein
MNQTTEPLALTTRARLVLGAALAVVLAVYLAFPNQDFAYDAMGYATGIAGDFKLTLFHPHHLLLHAAAWGWHRTLASFVAIDPMRSVQIINSLLGVLGAFLLFRILHILSRHFTASLLLVLLTAFSFSYWYFAIEFETYTGPLTVLIAATLVLITRPASFASVTASALLTALAVLLHQSHVLFVIPAAAYLYCAATGQRRLVLPAAFLAISGTVTLIPYLVAAQAQGHLSSLASFFRWVTLYAYTIESYGIKGWSNLPNSVFGFSRVFFASAHARNALLASEFGAMTVALVVCVFAWLLCAMLLIWIDRKAIRSALAAGERRCVSVFCATWIVSYSLFAMVVEPMNHEYWFPVLIPLVVAAAALVRWDRRKPTLIALMATITVTVNFVDFIYPSSFLENNKKYVLARQLNEHGIGDGDVVFINRSPVAEYSWYFYRAKIRMISIAELGGVSGTPAEEDFRETRDLILSAIASGRRVLLSANELGDPPRGTRRRGGLSGADVRRFVDSLPLSRKELFTFDIDGKAHVMYELVPLRPESRRRPNVGPSIRPMLSGSDSSCCPDQPSAPVSSREAP